MSFEMMLNGDVAADAEVGGAQYVAPSEVEDQQHLRRPHADALEFHQRLYDLRVGEPREAVAVEFARQRRLRDAAQILDLARGKSA